MVWYGFLFGFFLGKGVLKECFFRGFCRYVVSFFECYRVGKRGRVFRVVGSSWLEGVIVGKVVRTVEGE